LRKGSAIRDRSVRSQYDQAIYRTGSFVNPVVLRTMRPIVVSRLADARRAAVIGADGSFRKSIGRSDDAPEHHDAGDVSITHGRVRRGRSPVHGGWPIRYPADPDSARSVTSTSDRDPFGRKSGHPDVSVLAMPPRERGSSERVPSLRVLSVDWQSLFAYPMSGGFQSWSLIPGWGVGPVLASSEGCRLRSGSISRSG